MPAEGYEPETVFLWLKRGIKKPWKVKGGGKGLLFPSQDFLFEAITVIEKSIKRR